MAFVRPVLWYSSRALPRGRAHSLSNCRPPRPHDELRPCHASSVLAAQASGGDARRDARRQGARAELAGEGEGERGAARAAAGAVPAARRGTALLVQHLLTESVRLQHETAQQKVVTSAVDVQAARELLGELRKKHAELQAEHGRLTDAASSRGDATTAAWRALEQCGALLGRAVERLHQGERDGARRRRRPPPRPPRGVDAARGAARGGGGGAARRGGEAAEAARRAEQARRLVVDRAAAAPRRSRRTRWPSTAAGEAGAGSTLATSSPSRSPRLDASVSDARRRAAADKIARGGAAPPLPRALSAARQGSAGGSSAPSRDATPAAQRAELLKHYRAAEKGRAAESSRTSRTPTPPAASATAPPPRRRRRPPRPPPRRRGRRVRAVPAAEGEVPRAAGEIDVAASKFELDHNTPSAGTAPRFDAVRQDGRICRTTKLSASCSMSERSALASSKKLSGFLTSLFAFTLM